MRGERSVWRNLKSRPMPAFDFLLVVGVGGSFGDVPDPSGSGPVCLLGLLDSYWTFICSDELHNFGFFPLSCFDWLLDRNYLLEIS